jgi:hypothetical protein
VTFRAKWRGSPALSGAYDNCGSAGLDNIVSDGALPVDAKDAVDLHEQAMHETEVSSGDPHDRGDGLGIGEVGVVQPQSKLAPSSGQDE